MRQDAARRRTQIKDAISREVAANWQCGERRGSQYHGALAALALAELNLAHATVRSPVSRLRHASAASALAIMRQETK